jgi:hypothetical protein
MEDIKTPSPAEDLERQAQNLKWVQRDYVGALHLRLELERLHGRTGASVTQQVKNLNMMAHVAVHAGALGEAERAARKCLELYGPLATDNDERLATYLMMLACVLAERGKFEEAVVHGEQAVAIFRVNHGEQDSFVAYRKLDIERMRAKDCHPCLDKA